jgi:hypothetical protein
VLLAPPALSVPGYVDSPDHLRVITMHVRLERTDEWVKAKVVDVAATGTTTGGARAQVACFRAGAETALDYVAHPGRQPGGLLYAVGAVNFSFGFAISASWLTVPCGLQGGAIQSLISDRDSLTRIGRILDRASYAGTLAKTGMSPNGWDAALAHLTESPRGIDALEAAVPTSSLVVPGVRAQRSLLAHARYLEGDDLERSMRRKLLWQATLRCGVEPTRAQLDEVATIDATKISTLTSCPWR